MAKKANKPARVEAAGGSNKRPGGPPGVRWREGDRDCTLTKGTDGVYRYSLSYETVTATLAVDSQELEKTRRTPRFSRLIVDLFRFANHFGVHYRREQVVETRARSCPIVQIFVRCWDFHPLHDSFRGGANIVFPFFASLIVLGPGING